MKKTAIFFMMLLLVVSFAFAGCSEGNDQEINQLEARIELLEEQVAALNAGAEVGGSAGAGGAGTDSQKDFTAEIETLSDVVADAISQVEAIEPTGTEDEKMAQYLEGKKILDDADRQLDACEDEMELYYESGKLSAADYRAYDKDLDALSDDLDRAEDALERLFNIHD